MLQKLTDYDLEDRIAFVLYRPFDIRFIFYDDSLVWRTERQPPPWRARTDTEVALRALVLRLDALLTMRTEERHRLGVAQETVGDDIQAGIHLSRDTWVGCVLRTKAGAPCWIDNGA